MSSNYDIASTNIGMMIHTHQSIRHKVLIYTVFLMFFIFSCCVKNSNQPPIGSINLAPARGDSLTVFKMDANSFIDDITPFWQLKVRWDVNS